jgi:Asp-tRNA(Asn)/Glu-tRNA(Gln) amidotransferase A subunit family amidase
MALACSVAIPCGLDHAGMPFGIQVMSAPGNDRLVVEVARALEAVLAGHDATRRPIPDLAGLRA